MRMTWTRWLSLIVLIGLLAFGSLWVKSWLAHVSDRVVASVNQQTGLRLPGKKLIFDPKERRLYAKDILIEQPGIVVNARRITVVVNYADWWSLWLGDDFQALSDIELDGVSITVDPQRLKFRAPDWFQALTVFRGTLTIKNTGQPVLFEQLRVLNDEQRKLQLYFESAQSWTFDGNYDPGQNQLSGELTVNNISLSSLAAMTADKDQKMLDSDELLGEFSGKFALSWCPGDGLTLQGSAHGAKGQLLLPQLSASWQQWQLRNALFHSQRPGSAQLSISGVDLKLAASAKKIDFSNLLQQFLPFGNTSLIVSDSRLEQGAWVFTQLNGTVGRKALGDSWQYQLASRLKGVGAVQLSGHSGADNDFILKLNSARFAGPVADYGRFAGYQLKGARFSLGYDSKTHRGWIDFQDWPNSAAGLKALLTDSKGKARVSFALKPGETATALPERIYRAIGQQLMGIARAPLNHLNTATNSRLQPLLRHEAGKAALTPSAEQNLQQLKRIMAQRPSLAVVIHVGVSQSRDRPELTRHGLETALQELYQAAGGDGETVPADVRGRLLEQMYLATQQKKIPEVGKLTPEQRVKQAEEWLLANWPESTDQLDMLQEARYEFLKRTLDKIGLDAARIELTKSADDQTRSEPDSTLALR